MSVNGAFRPLLLLLLALSAAASVRAADMVTADIVVTDDVPATVTLYETPSLQPSPTVEPSLSALPVTPLTTGEKFHLHLDATAGPSSIFASAFAAGYSQAVDSVPEWGQGMEGYGKRFAHSFGQKAVSNTVRFGMQAMLHEDPRYYYSHRAGLWPRLWHAVGETFVAHKDAGGTRPNYSYFTGMAAGTYLSRQWRPEADRTTGEYFKSGATSVGVHVVKNIFREFLPDIRRKFRK
ncbi:MAG: hypothetical protein LBP68_06280 [Acidobacteriota bacterium]|jgi:hypothetical protein|nr:hypothetical protein [Acidobacteriota bacterium]